MSSDFDIKLVVGLGNPGKRYSDTRHNIGFKILDSFIASLCKDIPLKTKCSGKYIAKEFSGRNIFFLKPQTFMNLSGLSVACFCKAKKILPEEILVVHDDMDFPLGSIKLKIGGGSAGHNGIESVRAELCSNKFVRLRVGISRSAELSMTDYVLTEFTTEEGIILKDVIDLSVNAVKLTIMRGIRVAMNAINRIEKK